MTDRLWKWLGIAALLWAAAATFLWLSSRSSARSVAVAEAPGEPGPKGRASGASVPPAFDELAGLRLRVRELEAQLEVNKGAQKPAEAEGAVNCATSVGPGCPLLAPSRDVLLARARCGTVVSDVPPYLEKEESPEDEAPAETPDHALAKKVKQDFKAQLWTELDALYRELAGPAYKRTTSLARLRSRIQALATESANKPLLRQIAEERAGLRVSPNAEDLKTRSAAERYWRLWTAIGDRYEQFLGAALGAERARAARHGGGGWATKVMYVGNCPDSEG